MTWSDAKDDEAATSSKARHQETPTAPATNTKSRRRSTRRSLAVRNTANDDEEPAKVPSDRVTASDEVPDKVSSDRETVDHISDSDNALSPARQSIVTVTDFNPMQASTANSHQTTRRFTRQSMATFQSLTNVTVASSDSEDEENGDVIRGLLSNSPRALVKLSRAKHSLVEGNSEEQASNVTVTKRRTTRSPKKLLSRQTHASEVSDPSPGRTRASEAGDPPSQVSQAAAEPPSHHVPETSKTVASDKTHSRRTTRQSTRRSTRGKEPESGDDDNTIKLSPFQLSIDQPLPFNFYSSSSRSSHISKAQETTETSAATFHVSLSLIIITRLKPLWRQKENHIPTVVLECLALSSDFWIWNVILFYLIAADVSVVSCALEIAGMVIILSCCHVPTLGLLPSSRSPCRDQTHEYEGWYVIFFLLVSWLSSSD